MENANLNQGLNYIKANSTVKVKKARAVYDTDIAIMKIETVYAEIKGDLFLDGPEWCSYFKSFIAKNCFNDYDTYYNEKKKGYYKNYVVSLNETSISEGVLLNEDGSVRFGILVFPDYILGSENLIKSFLGEKGIANIKQYYEKGGKLFLPEKVDIY